MRSSRNPTTVMTANSEVQTREEATENVKELDLFVTVMLLEETPTVSFTREALLGSWAYKPLDQRSKTTSHQKWRENDCNITNLYTICRPCFIDEYNIHTYFFIQHLHRRIIWLEQKVPQPKEVEVRVRSHGAISCTNSKNRKHKSK